MVYTAEKEPIRAEVNRWIRSSSSLDGIVDFDAAVRDPANPKRFDTAYDSGDHLHPNEAGYRKMGDTIDIKLFN